MSVGQISVPANKVIFYIKIEVTEKEEMESLEI